VAAVNPVLLVALGGAYVILDNMSWKDVPYHGPYPPNDFEDHVNIPTENHDVDEDGIPNQADPDPWGWRDYFKAK